MRRGTRRFNPRNAGVGATCQAPRTDRCCSPGARGVARPRHVPCRPHPRSSARARRRVVAYLRRLSGRALGQRKRLFKVMAEPRYAAISESRGPLVSRTNTSKPRPVCIPAPRLKQLLGDGRSLHFPASSRTYSGQSPSAPAGLAPRPTCSTTRPSSAPRLGLCPLSHPSRSLSVLARQGRGRSLDLSQDDGYRGHSGVCRAAGGFRRRILYAASRSRRCVEIAFRHCIFSTTPSLAASAKRCCGFWCRRGFHLLAARDSGPGGVLVESPGWRARVSARVNCDQGEMGGNHPDQPRVLRALRETEGQRWPTDGRTQSHDEKVQLEPGAVQ